MKDGVIVKNPNILGGTPVFRGTRVPLHLLFDSLNAATLLKSFSKAIRPFHARWLSPRWKKLDNCSLHGNECASGGRSREEKSKSPHANPAYGAPGLGLLG